MRIESTARRALRIWLSLSVVAIPATAVAGPFDAALPASLLTGAPDVWTRAALLTDDAPTPQPDAPRAVAGDTLAWPTQLAAESGLDGSRHAAEEVPLPSSDAKRATAPGDDRIPPTVAPGGLAPVAMVLADLPARLSIEVGPGLHVLPLAERSVTGGLAVRYDF